MHIQLSQSIAPVALVVALAGGCSLSTQGFGGGSQPPMVQGIATVRVVGNRIEIDDKIQFATDSDEILTASHALLDKIVETLQEHTEIGKLRVEGHTDATGSPEHNQDLSQRRAAAVARYLTEHGVTQELIPNGHGQSQPLCQEESDECNAQNRRVEFIIDSE